MKQMTARPNPVECTLYLCLVVDWIVRPGMPPAQVSAQITVLSLALEAAAVFAALWVLKYWGSLASKKSSGRASAFCAFVTAFLLCLGAGQSAACTLLFLNISIDRRFSAGLFLVLLLFLALYAAGMGSRGILRAGEILFVLFIFTVLMIVASNLKNACATNLIQSSSPLRQTIITAASCWSLPLAIPAAQSILITADTPISDRKTKQVIGAAYCTAALFAIGCELVLGQMAAVESQPFYLFSKVGSLSVFRRLAPAGAFVFLLILAQKTAFLLAAAYDLLSKHLPGALKEKRLPAICCGGVSLVAAFYFLSCGIGTAQLILTLGASISLLVLPVVQKGEALRTANET